MRWRTSAADPRFRTGSGSRSGPKNLGLPQVGGGSRFRICGTSLIPVLGILLGAEAASADSFLAATPEAPAGYGAFLKQYVVKTDLAEPGFETRFDYAKLYGQADQIGIRNIFRKHFLDQLPSEIEPESRIAWALNAYNFFVIDLVMTHATAHEGELPASVKDLGEDVFTRDRFTIEGETYSLDSFERRFLFLDRDPQSGKVPARLDPRLHFALVCGAVGCPPLWPEPFRGRKLDEMLDTCVANALAGPRHLHAQGKTIHASQIFSWYKTDFANHGGVVGFIKEFAPDGRKKSLFGGELMKPVVTDIEWDWGLNRP